MCTLCYRLINPLTSSWMNRQLYKRGIVDKVSHQGVPLWVISYSWLLSLSLPSISNQLNSLFCHRFLLLKCSTLPQICSNVASRPWTGTSETVSLDKSLLLEVDFLKYLSVKLCDRMFLDPSLVSQSLNFPHAFHCSVILNYYQLADPVILGLTLNITNSICSQDDRETYT